MCRQRTSYFWSRYAYFSVTMPIFGHLSLIRSYSFNSYQLSIEGEIILLDCLCLLSHIWIFTILLMFCGCFEVEFINRTISVKIKHNRPVQFRVKSIMVLCISRWRMIFNLSHEVFCASQNTSCEVFCASQIHNIWNYSIYYKNGKVNTCMITSSHKPQPPPPSKG